MEIWQASLRRFVYIQTAVVMVILATSCGLTSFSGNLGKQSMGKRDAENAIATEKAPNNGNSTKTEASPNKNSGVPESSIRDEPIVHWRAVGIDKTVSDVRVVFLTFKGKTISVSSDDFMTSLRIDLSRSVAILEHLGMPQNTIPSNLNDLTYDQANSFIGKIGQYAKTPGPWCDLQTQTEKKYCLSWTRQFDAPRRIGQLNEALVASAVKAHSCIAKPDEGNTKIKRRGYTVKYVGDLDKDGQPDNAELDGFANYVGPFNTFGGNTNGSETGTYYDSINWNGDLCFMGLSPEEIRYVKSLSTSTAVPMTYIQ